MTMTALPPAPLRGEAPETFSTKADALLGALPGFVTEANALAQAVSGYEQAALGYRNEAITHKDAAATSATAAADSAAAAAASAAAISDPIYEDKGVVTTGNVTLNLAAARAFLLTVNAASQTITIALQNVPPYGRQAGFTVYLVTGAGATNTALNWPVNWTFTAAQTIAAGKLYVIEAETVNGGADGRLYPARGF